MEMFARSPRFARDGRVRTRRVLDAVAADGWQVMYLAERSAHLLVGHGGAFMVVTEDPYGPVPPSSGVQQLIVVWRPFPDEVQEVDGGFLVHGDVLLDFLRAQRGLLDTYEAPDA